MVNAPFLGFESRRYAKVQCLLCLHTATLSERQVTDWCLLWALLEARFTGKTGPKQPLQCCTVNGSFQLKPLVAAGGTDFPHNSVKAY